MTQGARVNSLEALRLFKLSIFKFAETANVAMGDAESEMRKTQVWLETEQQSYWTNQMRLRHEAVTKAREAVRQKKIYKSPTGAQRSASEEEKVLAKAVKSFEEAQFKLAATKRNAQRMQRELLLYQGQAQRFATAVQVDLPNAAAKLDQMLATLESYLGLRTIGSVGSEADASTSAAGGDASMARPEGGEITPIAEYPQLRSRVPTAEQRAKAESIENIPATWTTPLVGEAEREKIAAQRYDLEVPKPEQWVYAKADVWNEAKIYLHRYSGASREESGWWIGSADGVIGASIVRMPVELLGLTRPDLHEVLKLSTGFLLVIDGGGIKAMLDPADVDLWATAGQPAAEASAGQSTKAQEAP